jgi:hypothetical protein
MTVGLQANFTWDIVSPVSYQAGQELRVNLSFTAPKGGLYYILGALFDRQTEAYIEGSLFGIYVPEGADYAIGSPQWVSLWEVTEGQEVSIPCRLNLVRTDALLGLFLFRMEGEAPDLSVDEQAAYLVAELVKPAGIDLSAIISVMVVVMVVGMVSGIALKE